MDPVRVAFGLWCRPPSPCYHENVQREWLSRDRLAVVAGLLGPLALAAILVPFRAHFPNTDAALAMLLVVVAVAANGQPAGRVPGRGVHGGVVRLLPDPAV